MSLTAEGISEEVTEVIREAPPRYSLKVESFSLLSTNSVEKYESCTFEVGSYKWKLLLYPNGDPTRNVSDHVSLYLAMDKNRSLTPGWEVNVIYRFLVYDQIRDNYLTIGDPGGTVRRFHGIKTKWGFSKLISLARFKDPSNGYLVDDICEFGVDIFIVGSTCGSERLSMLSTRTRKYSWKVENFSEMDRKYYFSDVFSTANHKWKIKFYPKGDAESGDNSLSLFLFLADSEPLHLNTKIYVRYKICIRNQLQGNSKEYEDHDWFKEINSGWGWSKFISAEKFKDVSKGFLLNDVCIIEAEVTELGSRGSNT